MQTAPPTLIRTEHVTRRRGIGSAAARLGVTYSHFYRCLRWLNGDLANGRKPGRDLEASIRSAYPELITRKEQHAC